MKKSWLLLISAVALYGCPPAEVGTLLGASITAPSAPVFTNGSVELTLDVTGGPDKVVLLRDGEEIGPVAAPYKSATLDTTTWTEGPHAVTVRASLRTTRVDSNVLDVTVDRTAPTVMRRWPEGPAWWSGGFGVELSEPVTAVAGPLSVQVGTAAATAAPGQLSADGRTYSAQLMPTYTSLPVTGQVSLAAAAFADRAGNTSAAASWAFDVARWTKTQNLVTTGRAGYFARVAVDSTGAAYV